MNFPRYPKYKDSCVDWLGPVPEHWGLLPCRAIVHERSARNEDGKSENYLSLMANVGIIPYAEKGDIGNKKPEDLSKCKMVNRGDFVINSMNYGIGSYGVSAYDGICSPVYIVLTPQSHVVRPGFAFRVFENRAFQGFAQSFGNGILEHRCSINWDVLKGISVAVPPQPEQDAILNFLDRETAKNNALIAEQQRLIELLREKRQAIISQAVSKGLNPNAPVKPSGIEWLGDVPAHWQVRRVKAVASFITSGPRGWSERVGEQGALFVQSGDLDDALGIRFEGLRRVIVHEDAEAARTRLQSGDVVVCITGAKTGNVAVCANAPEPAYINQHLALIRPARCISPEFLATILKSDLGRTYFDVSQYGLKQGLSLENVKDAPVLVPPIQEQVAIVNHLTSHGNALQRLVVSGERTIELLQERRAALISAAVNGQIDVRHLQKDTA
ncbi:MAG TPA: restriction endonuclease subunit S [Verrucomicrobiae bacterium]